MPYQPWRWEPTSERRRRQAGEFRRLAGISAFRSLANVSLNAPSLPGDEEPELPPWQPPEPVEAPPRSRQQEAKEFVRQARQRLAEREAEREPEPSAFRRFGERVGGGLREVGEAVGERLVGERERGIVEAVTEPRQLPRRFAGRLGQALGMTAQQMLSGEKFLAAYGIDISELPRPVREAIDVGAAPVTWATAGIGPGLSAALKASGRLGPRILAAITEPVVSGGFGKRLASEVALGTAGLVAGEEAVERLPEGTPAALRVAAGLGAGVVGGGAAIAGIRAAERGLPRAGARLARATAEEAFAAGPIPRQGREIVGRASEGQQIVGEIFDIDPGTSKAAATRNRGRSFAAAEIQSVLDNPDLSIDEQITYLSRAQEAIYEEGAMRQGRVEAAKAAGPAPKFGTQERSDWEAARMQASAERPLTRQRRTPYESLPWEELQEADRVYEHFLDSVRIEPAGEQLVERIRFDEMGQMVREPTFATEAELQGYRATQAPLPMGKGELPTETAGPLFAPRAAEVPAGAGVSQHWDSWSIDTRAFLIEKIGSPVLDDIPFSIRWAELPTEAKKLLTPPIESIIREQTVIDARAAAASAARAVPISERLRPPVSKTILPAKPPPAARAAIPEQPIAPPAARPQPEAAPPPGRAALEEVIGRPLPRERPPAGALPPPVQPPRGRPPTGSFEDALRTIRREVRRQLKERRAGIIGEAIHKGRQRQVASFREAFAQAETQGLQGFEAEQAARRMMAGALTEVPPLENVAPEHFDAIVEGISKNYREGGIREFQFINELGAVRRLRDGGPALQPRQIDTMRHILGDDLTDLLVERQRSIAGAQPEQRTALEQLAERFAKEADVLRATSQPFRAAQQAQEQMLNALRSFDRLSAGQADRVRLAGLKKLNDLDTAEVKRLRGYLDAVAGRAERVEGRAAALDSRKLQRIAEARDVSDLVGPIREAGDEQALRVAIQRAMEAGDERIRTVGQRAFDRMDELQRTQTARYNQVVAQQSQRAETREAALASQRAAREGAVADVRYYRQQLNDLLRNFRNARRAGDYGFADGFEARLRQTIDDALAAGDDPIKHAGIRAQIAMESRLPNADAMLLKARSLLEARKGPFENVSEEARRTLITMGDNWIEANRVLLDGLDSELGGVYQTARSVLTGELPDSFLTGLVTRRGFLTAAAERVIDDPKLARQYADALMERELILRYGKNRPEKVKQILDLTKRTTGELDPDFWDTLVQRGKNTAFGIGDFGVWGVNILKALATGNIQLFAGSINRALILAHLPHVQLEMLESGLSKRLAYELKGLHYGVGPSAVRAKEGTLLSYIPVVGKYVDMPLIAISDGLNRLQYEVILNPVREIAFEGNLVMQRLLRRDITNPRVQAAAIENANALSSFGRTALRAGRAKAERTLLTSSPMTRSQFATLMQVSKLVRTGATADERIMAAMTIASTAGAMLFVGKWLNDQIGVDEFEFNPAESGFGDIHLRNGGVINLFSQQSLVKAIARSFDALKEGDPEAAAKAAARFGLGRTSLVGETISAAFGTGYEPGRGFVFGEMEQGIGQRALNLAPMPPIVQSVLLEEAGDPFLLGIEAIGITAFPESAYAVMNREAQRLYGEDYQDLEPYQKKEVEAKPTVAKTQAAQPTTEPRWKQYEETNRRRLGEETDAVAWYKRTGDGPAFREMVSDIQANAAVERAQVDRDFRLFKQSGKMPTDPNKRGLVEYYNAYDKARLPGGKLDYEVLDAEMATLQRAWTPQQQAYIDRNTGLTEHVPEVKRLYDDKEKLRPYWDIADRVFAKAAGRDSYVGRRLASYRSYRALASAADDGDAKAKSALSFIDDDISRQRRALRMENPSIDAALSEWYGATPIKQQQKARAPLRRLPVRTAGR